MEPREAGYSRHLRSSLPGGRGVRSNSSYCKPIGQPPRLHPGSRRPSLQLTCGIALLTLSLSYQGELGLPFLNPHPFFSLNLKLALALVSASLEVTKARATASSCFCTTHSRSTLPLWGHRDTSEVKGPGEAENPTRLARGQED